MLHCTSNLASGPKNLVTRLFLLSKNTAAILPRPASSTALESTSPPNRCLGAWRDKWDTLYCAIETKVENSLDRLDVGGGTGDMMVSALGGTRFVDRLILRKQSRDSLKVNVMLKPAEKVPIGQLVEDRVCARRASHVLIISLEFC